MPKASKRDQLIETAADLFYRGGFNATGIDRILAEAGVAKMTLYNHFGSKEELIEAALHHRGSQFQEWLMAYVESHAETPRDRLLALFDAHEEWFESKEFRGCLFLNASAEFAGSTESIRRIAEEYKRLLHGYVRGLAAAGQIANPDRLADRIMLLVDGAIGCAQVSKDPTWAQRAKEAAALMIDAEGAPVPAAD